MKNILFLSFIFFLHSQLFAQINLFNLSQEEYNNLTNSPENSITLSVNNTYLNLIKETRPCQLDLHIPFLDGTELKLYLEIFDVFTSDFQIIRNTSEGIILDDYNPKILSYRIKGENVSGVFSFLENNIVATIKYNGKAYELKGEKDGPYILFDISDSVVSSYFECQTEDIDIDLDLQTNNPQNNNQSTECVEMGIDTDYYTFLEFDSNCYNVVEWVLAVLAGVSEIYMSELDEEVLLQARYINVRENQDNYYNLNDCSDMLDELGEYWTSAPLNTLLNDVDLIHLFTRKQANGGVAWVDAICSSNGYYKGGVSSGLNTNLSYDYPDNTPFSYNMSYVGHEIGHNFGANHTHWCGWDPDAALNFGGGAIDSCYPVEGNCAGPGDPNVGTLMSYCDLAGITSALQFHPIVKSQALFPNIFSNQASCFGTCGELETSCEGTFVFGCTDEFADNYNPEANIDDDSCICANQFIFSITDSYGDGISSQNTGGNNPNYFIIGDGGLEYVQMNSLDYGAGETHPFCLSANTDCFNFYLSTDYWSSEVSWEIIQPDGSILDSGGDYSNGGVTIDETYCFSVECLNDTDGDGICDENEIIGCQDLTACNYNQNATDPGNCTFAEQYYDCDGNCLNDNDSDAICNELDNCQNTFNPSQEDLDQNGVGDLCENIIGCTDETACNYNADATVECNCCSYAIEYYDCDGNCLNDANDNGICDELEEVIFGCTDISACNYNQLANADDGSCDYAEEYYDCFGNCLNDQDEDVICDEFDNCIDIFNPGQDDSDNDGIGDECACEQMIIVGENVVESGTVETYDITSQINNNYSWSVINGDIIWDSAIDSSISILWGEQGSGTVVITQMFGNGLFCETTLDVIIMPSTTSLEEILSSNEIIKVTDVLGRDITLDNVNTVLIVYYKNGNVKKIYKSK